MIQLIILEIFLSSMNIFYLQKLTVEEFTNIYHISNKVRNITWWIKTA